ncbi:MAG TPA: DUF418 domain-containing protein [Allosphingosinicella sp.]
METTAAPGPTTDRIDLLDALRGFALFGILLANILYWSGWIFMQEPARLALAGEAGMRAQHLFHHALIDGKFYTLFSLLFGIGFSLQLSRLERRGANGVRIFRRRLLVLLAIGVIHMVAIWDGDILTLYALLGLLLPFFRNWNDRRVLIAALLLILSPIAGVALFQAFGWAPHLAINAWADSLAVRLGGTPQDLVGWLRRSDPPAFFAWVMSGWPYSLSTRVESWRIPKVLGIMLLGLVLGRRLAAGTLLDDRRLMWRTFWAGLAIGLPVSIAYALTPNANQASLPAIVGTVPLALAYAAGFVLLWPRAKALLGLLAWPGRMALTNYLMHSLIGIALFYGIGLGLVGRVPPAGIYLIAVAIFAGQVLLSRLWLARFDQGPMERLWRRLTYGARPKPSAAAAEAAG